MNKCLTSLSCWGDNLSALAERVEELRYDKVAEFLNQLSICFSRRVIKDKEANKPELAVALQDIANRLETAAIAMDVIWDICEHHETESK